MLLLQIVRKEGYAWAFLDLHTNRQKLIMQPEMPIHFKLVEYMLSAVPARQREHIISKWLEMKDIGNLDMAACNSIFRRVYLDVLSMDSFSFGEKDEDFGSHGREFLDWLISRKSKQHDSIFHPK